MFFFFIQGNFCIVVIIAGVTPIKLSVVFDFYSSGSGTLWAWDVIHISFILISFIIIQGKIYVNIPMWDLSTVGC